jgi:hypothetical protein
MTLAPNPQFPEKGSNVYEMKEAGNASRRGPLRFEEGIATDTDVPNDFELGMQQGFAAAAGRPNRNAPVHTKTAAETMQARAHVGSAAWTEAPTFLAEFSHGSFTDYAEQKTEVVARSGGRTQRTSPTVVND